ncbi:hypothetical protein TWF481_006557 [Arthrobotrys musiformis]|uniref:Bromo domain-containing protein n=1 Tax=Arthrobotrys musiformis TaxID=47236 RepID=A0AAV9WAK2_9PEZI
MPSTATLSAPTSPTSYDHLEKLLLCAEVVQYGETGQSFVAISSALKENPLLTASPNYDPGRLSGDTLRERWRDLVRDEGFGGGAAASSTDGETGAAAAVASVPSNTTTTATTTPARPRGSRVAMRNGMITSSAATPAVPPPPPPPPPQMVASGVNVPIGEKAVRDLTRRMWESYQNMMKEQIQADERSIAQLLDEIGNLENERAREIEEMEAAEEERKKEAARVAAAAAAAAEREAAAAREAAVKEAAAREAAAKEAAAKEAALAAAAAAAAAAKEAAAKEAVKDTPKPVSPVAVEGKKLEEPFVETSGQQQKAQQHALLRTTPPSPSKASLRNILSDEPAQSVPLERQTSSDRVGYDPIRDGARPNVGSETAQQQRYPPIQPTEPVQGGYQIYEKPPASLRRASGSGPRPQPPEFGHIPSGSPRPPLTPTGPRIGTFPQSAQRGDMVPSPVYPRHEHEAGYPNGHQSPIGPLNMGPRPTTEEARTPRQAHLPPFSPTTPSYPQPHSSPSRPHFVQPLPSIHQLSPQRAPVQPPGYPAPMQRLPSSEYLPHHSPVSEHQPLHSPMGYNNVVPHSPFGLPHPSHSPRTPGFPQPMPPPQYSPTHTHYQNQYPHAQQQQQSPTQTGFTPLQPAFSPQQREYPPPSHPPPQTPIAVAPPAAEDNRLPPINTPAQLPPLQFVTPKPSEQSGRLPSPIRPRPEEISPVLAPDDASAGVPDFPLDRGKKRKIVKGRGTKVEATTNETEEPTKTGGRSRRHESVEVSEEKTLKPKGKGSRGVSKSRGTAASTRPRRGQSVSSVGSRTGDPDEMDIDEPATKEESVAPEPIESKPRKSSQKKKAEAIATEDESETAPAAAPSTTTKRNIRRGHHQHQPSASTEPDYMPTDHNAVETPRDESAGTPAADPATPRPSFHLDMSINATPTSGSSSAVKKFAQRANPLLNNVSAHRYANLFMKPVDERLAPGYSRIVYKPQDIKSIRALIKAGAAQNATGTPTLTPTPTTADGPSMSFGTTPSTPTTSVANAPMSTRGATITNSSQLEKEIWRMFANAVMYNKSNSQVAQEAREMARDIGIAIDNFRSAERIGERKAAEAAKEKEKEKEKERRGGRGRRGSLIKSEVFGEDDSERGDVEEEDEVEVEIQQPSKERKTGRAVRGKKGKQDKDGDVEMEDKTDDDEEAAVGKAEEEEETEKSGEEESEEEEEGSDEEEEQEEEEEDEEEDEEEEEEEEEEQKPTKKGKAAVSKAKPKTTRSSAATAKGRGRKGSLQEEVEDEPKGRGRGAGRTRAAKR